MNSTIAESRKMPVFDTDKPITTQEEDRLGRSQFANTVAQILLEQNATESHVIGLYGKWGSGKTSTINLIKEQIEPLAPTSDHDPIVLSFSSWGSTSVSDVFAMFIDSLNKEVSRSSKTKTAFKKLLENLLEYSACVSGICPPAESAIGKMLNLIKKRKERTLPELKSQIAKTLKGQKKRLIVVIDDIDRLSNEQIRHVFQFVNVIADFPNVTYLLPFDHGIVATALSDIQGINGSAYLSKIIQIPLYLPDPSPNSLLALLNSEIGSLLDEAREDYSESRMFEIIEKYITPYMKTPRDVRRLQNVFLFQMRLFSENLNCLDLFALSSLMAFDPALYQWIRENKSLVLGEIYTSKQAKHKEHLRVSFESIGLIGSRTNDAIETLSVLFPSINNGKYLNNKSYWRDRRVCHKEIFDGYFAGRLKDDWLSTRNVANAVYLKDFTGLRKLANKSIEEKNFLFFLEEIRCRLDAYSTQELYLLGKMLFYCWGKSAEESQGLFFPIRPDDKIEYIIKIIFERIGSDEAAVMIQEEVPALNASGLAAFAVFLNSEESAHGQLLADSPNEAKQHLSKTGLKKTEELFLNRLSELKTKAGFLQHDHLYLMMYLWAHLDENDYRVFWNNLIQDDPLNTCYLINSCAGKWTSGEAYGWDFNENTMEKVMPKEKIIQVVRLLKSNGIPNTIPDSILEKVILLYSSSHKDPGDTYRITAQECRTHFNEWRKKQ